MAERVNGTRAAILSAAPAGDTRIMAAADEEEPNARPRVPRKDLAGPIIAEHDGRIVTLMGNGIPVELAYVIDAGCCATDFVTDPRPDPTWPPLWPCVQPCHVSEEDDPRNLGQVHNSPKIS